MLNGEFYWFFGIVEERNDSSASDGLKLGRVKVRIIGIHSPYRTEDNSAGEGIRTEQLHWAYPIMPFNNAAMQGIGMSPTGIVEGTQVFGFARDGEMFQDLIILGTVNGQHIRQYNTDIEGFCDPSGTYPKPDKLGESDVNRLARNDKISQTIVQTKRDSRITGIKKALGGTWSQPKIPYAATYPYNHVYESESGHIKEYDDTLGQERIHEYHKSGTFSEIDKDGTKVQRIIKDNYQLVIGDDYIHVDGACIIHVGGNANVKVDGDLVAEVDGNSTTETHGNVSHKIDGNYSLQVAGNIDIDGSRVDIN